MRRRPIGPALAALILLAGAVGERSARAQGEAPGQLHTIRSAGPHQVNVGDLMQVRFVTQSASNGIGALEVGISGGSVRRIGVVTSDIDPTRPGQPGAPYYIIAFLRAERAGAATITVTPVTNEGRRLAPFRFQAQVQGGF